MIATDPDGAVRAATEGSARRDALVVFGVALAVRMMVVAWASDRFPPAADAHFYHVVAVRIANGLGYTWQWPDGAVTYAAHYPVGYPAILGGLYALAGPSPLVGMTFNALIGAIAAVSAYAVAATTSSRRGALLAGLLVALHPALVAYTAALMTEGVTAALLVIAASCAVWVGRAPDVRWTYLRLIPLGLLFGALTLIRPQSFLLAPVFGALAVMLDRSAAVRGSFPALRRCATAALITGGVALSCSAPWTIRNCARMDRCVWISANAGWNLYIGAAPRAKGGWAPLDELGVPVGCRHIFGEAAKDACFERAALVAIGNDPLRWLALIPKKLSETFDYSGAPGWYLHASNAARFDDRMKVLLGTVETIWERFTVLLALAAVAITRGPHRGARGLCSAIGAASLFFPFAWVAHLAFVVAAALLGKRLVAHPPAAFAATSVGGTMIAHAVFFGAGRYSMVCFGVLGAVAGSALARGRIPRESATADASATLGAHALGERAP